MIVTVPPTEDPVSNVLVSLAISLVINNGSKISIFPPEPAVPVPVPPPVEIEASVKVIDSPFVSSSTAPPAPPLPD